MVTNLLPCSRYHISLVTILDIILHFFRIELCQMIRNLLTCTGLYWFVITCTTLQLHVKFARFIISGTIPYKVLSKGQSFLCYQPRHLTNIKLIFKIDKICNIPKNQRQNIGSVVLPSNHQFLLNTSKIWYYVRI